MFNHPLANTPFGTALELCIVLAMLCWVLSLLTRDYSWVDRLWSVVPAVYCLIVASNLDFRDVRVNVMSALVVLWAIRLTFNLALKGGYKVGSEDYKLVYLKERIRPLEFQLLNVISIPIQMALLWLLAAPIHQAWVYSGQPLNWLDYLAAVLFLVLLGFESIADAQMWRFQQHKKQQIAEGIEVMQPFMAEGLYRFCRHPNYLCEIGIWVTFYLFAISGSTRILHWTGLGFLLLILLVLSSSRLGEKISNERYPAYCRYQAIVPMLIPALSPSRRWKTGHADIK